MIIVKKGLLSSPFYVSMPVLGNRYFGQCYFAFLTACFMKPLFQTVFFCVPDCLKLKGDDSGMQGCRISS